MTDLAAQFIELGNQHHNLRILPQLGGSVGLWQKDGQDIFRPVANEDLIAQKGEAVGAYPLFPYSNRIEKGRFSFGGRDFVLEPNMAGSEHPIHGNAWEQGWTIEHQTKTHLVLAFNHQPVDEQAGQWPFAYRAVLSYALRHNGLEVGMVIENRDTVEQPVGFGFHPFFAVSPQARLGFEAEGVWLTTYDGLPQEHIPAGEDWSFSPARPFHDLQIDNVFSGFTGKARLEDPEFHRMIEIEAGKIFGHLVVFTPKDGDFVALEPVTNMTNAHNQPLEEQHGLHVLKPGGRAGGVMRFMVRDLPDKKRL